MKLQIIYTFIKLSMQNKSYRASHVQPFMAIKLPFHWDLT